MRTGKCLPSHLLPAVASILTGGLANLRHTHVHPYQAFSRLRVSKKASGACSVGPGGFRTFAAGAFVPATVTVTVTVTEAIIRPPRRRAEIASVGQGGKWEFAVIAWRRRGF